MKMNQTEQELFDICLGAILIQAETLGYKEDEPEEWIEWELAKSLWSEYQKGKENMEAENEEGQGSSWF